MNLGLTSSLKIGFPDLIPMLRPKIEYKIPDPYWVAGFTAAECFYVRIYTSPATKLGK